MNFQIDVSSTLANSNPVTPPAPGTSNAEIADLLRQILEVQRDQLAYQRAAAQAHDMSARWRNFLARWQQEFPGLAEGCRKAFPALERSYGRLIAELTEQLNEDPDDPLQTDFALQEFLDRYGMRLAQLGTILNLVGPLADAAPPAGDNPA